ncbi:hypothetical protein [Bacillus paranthracis]|uniref:hypothetical protein n=1 Tax=Bacillus paranthracis TaxID=2026186 RepID=UPI002D79E1EB|nr:hypothetical protein [Bacillus paranthracis]
MEKTFKQELEELIAKHAIRHEDTEYGYLVALKNNEFIQIDLIDDSNDLDRFKDEEEDIIEEEKEWVYICADCLESHDEEVKNCFGCGSDEISIVPKGDVQLFKYGK